MEEKLTLSAQPRNLFGKKVKQLRKKGLIPAILYGHGIKPQPLMVEETAFERVFKEAGTSSLVNLKIGDERAKKVLIHEPQYHPKTLKPIHVDFYQVKMTEKIQTEIPLKLIGEAPAVKELGGTLITNRDTIEVQCLPDDLIHEIEVDISTIKSFEDKILVSDLKIPKNIEVLNEPNEVVVSVSAPMSEEELAELEAPVEEKVEEVEEVEEEKPEEEIEEEKKEEEEKPAEK